MHPQHCLRSSESGSRQAHLALHDIDVQALSHQQLGQHLGCQLSNVAHLQPVGLRGHLSQGYYVQWTVKQRSTPRRPLHSGMCRQESHESAGGA